MLTPPAPTTPRGNSEAKDANPWEASWGDLLSSEESDTEFDKDSSQSSSSGGSTADVAGFGLDLNASVNTSTDAQAQTAGSELLSPFHQLQLVCAHTWGHAEVSIVIHTIKTSHDFTMISEDLPMVFTLLFTIYWIAEPLLHEASRAAKQSV